MLQNWQARIFGQHITHPRTAAPTLLPRILPVTTPARPHPRRPTVHVHYMLSPVRLSVVSNARAPYSGGSNFPQYFYGIWYLGHPLISTENFMEIVPGEPLRRGS